MGRTIKIELTEDQRTELDQGYRNGATHVFRQRCHMVLLKADNRRSVDVAAIVGVCAHTVNGGLWRYKRAGITGLATHPAKVARPFCMRSRTRPRCGLLLPTIGSALRWRERSWKTVWANAFPTRRCGGF